MSNYRVLAPVTKIDDLATGDLCTLKLPDGRTVKGTILTRPFSPDLESPLRTVWFDDGRSYPVSLEGWPSFCRFVEGWHDTDNDMRKEQA